MSKIFETDIDVANHLIAEWTAIASDIARQCRWRPRGKCLITCLGLALCNLERLTLVDTLGRPAADLSQDSESETQNPEA